MQNHGGYQIACFYMGKLMYDLKPDEIWFCTSILYEGTPDYPKPDMWRDIFERNKVTALGASPKGISALMKAGTDLAKKHDLSKMKKVICAGEVLNPAA